VQVVDGAGGAPVPCLMDTNRRTELVDRWHVSGTHRRQGGFPRLLTQTVPAAPSCMEEAGTIRFVDDPRDIRKKLISRDDVEKVVRSLTPS